MDQPKAIHISGRRWFEKTNGNTYHSVRIYVDGEHVHTIPFEYGYGSQWEWTARGWLENAGYLPGIEARPGSPGEALWVYCERKGIKLVREVVDVSRKRDL